MSLMDKINETEEVKETPKVEDKKDDGTTKVPTSMLEQLQKQINDQAEKIKELQKRGPEDNVEEDYEEEVHKPLARFKLWDGDKICIGFNKERGMWKFYNTEMREYVLMQEITLRDKEGKETTMEVISKDFFEEAREISLPIIEIKSKPTLDKKGFTTIKTVGREGYSTIDTGKKVRQVVKGLDSKAVVEMPDGKVLELDIDFINM